MTLPEHALFRVGIALLPVLAGILIGGPMVLSGEPVLIFLDQRRYLASINSRLRKWGRARAEAVPSTFGDRFRRNR
jgi:hypothetical protein